MAVNKARFSQILYIASGIAVSLATAWQVAGWGRPAKNIARIEDYAYVVQAELERFHLDWASEDQGLLFVTNGYVIMSPYRSSKDRTGPLKGGATGLLSGKWYHMPAYTEAFAGVMTLTNAAPFYYFDESIPSHGLIDFHLIEGKFGILRRRLLDLVAQSNDFTTSAYFEAATNYYPFATFSLGLPETSLLRASTNSFTKSYSNLTTYPARTAAAYGTSNWSKTRSGADFGQALSRAEDSLTVVESDTVDEFYYADNHRLNVFSSLYSQRINFDYVSETRTNTYYVGMQVNNPEEYNPEEEDNTETPYPVYYVRYAGELGELYHADYYPEQYWAYFELGGPRAGFWDDENDVWIGPPTDSLANALAWYETHYGEFCMIGSTTHVEIVSVPVFRYEVSAVLDAGPMASGSVMFRYPYDYRFTYVTNVYAVDERPAGAWWSFDPQVQSATNLANTLPETYGPLALSMFTTFSGEDHAVAIQGDRDDVLSWDRTYLTNTSIKLTSCAFEVSADTNYFDVTIPMNHGSFEGAVSMLLSAPFTPTYEVWGPDGDFLPDTLPSSSYWYTDLRYNPFDPGNLALVLPDAGEFNGGRRIFYPVIFVSWGFETYSETEQVPTFTDLRPVAP